LIDIVNNIYIDIAYQLNRIHDTQLWGKFNGSYPYIGLILHGKNATENTNWEAEGDKLRLSLRWYEIAVQTKDLKPCINKVN
jgi:hypothetical protein